MITEKLIRPQVTHVRVYVLRVILEIIVKLKVIDFWGFLIGYYKNKSGFLEDISPFFLETSNSCASPTCNNQGQVDTTSNLCECFDGYSGTNCEIEGKFISNFSRSFFWFEVDLSDL